MKRLLRLIYRMIFAPTNSHGPGGARIRPDPVTIHLRFTHSRAIQHPDWSRLYAEREAIRAREAVGARLARDDLARGVTDVPPNPDASASSCELGAT